MDHIKEEMEHIQEKIANWEPPQLPQIEFADYDEAEVEAWVAGKEADQSALDQQWEEAWNAYQAAIAQPWNDFLTTAEGLAKEEDRQDAQTFDESVRFIANNTFIDGVPLIEAYPEVEEFLANMWREQAANEESWNLDKIRAPMSLNRIVMQEEAPCAEWAIADDGSYFCAVYDGEDEVNKWNDFCDHVEK
jgi:hypothetical protein